MSRQIELFTPLDAAKQIVQQNLQYLDINDPNLIKLVNEIKGWEYCEHTCTCDTCRERKSVVAVQKHWSWSGNDYKICGQCALKNLMLLDT